MFIKFLLPQKLVKIMAKYLTWQEMYELAYHPATMDLGSVGRDAARAWRQLDFQGELHHLTRHISHSPLERAFFAIGDEASRVNVKLWNLQGGSRSMVQSYNLVKPFPLKMMAAGALGGAAMAVALLYLTQ